MNSIERFHSRDVSWLSFNARVLQEANDPSVPLLERIKFLGIFSSNLDEFFKVRVATLKRMLAVKKGAKTLLGRNPKDVLERIQEIVLAQSKIFQETFQEIIEELAVQKIFLRNEEQLNPEQESFARQYFHDEIRPYLFPLILNRHHKYTHLKDQHVYLAVDLSVAQRGSACALIEIPTESVPRFLILPAPKDQVHIILLDDIIRLCIHEILLIPSDVRAKAYAIKLTRDAELDIDNDVSESLMDKISKGVRKRKKGLPVRFIYDETIPHNLLSLLMKKLGLKDGDSLNPGARYHNFRDFMNFPSVGSPTLRHPAQAPIRHAILDPHKSTLAALNQQDVAVHYPYHSFNYLIDLLREASMDPQVKSIKMTLYRVASKSSVVSALINAAKNGKAVTVFVELQARFDEEANIAWATKLQDEGVRVISGILNLKVHAKLCLIRRLEDKRFVEYANLSKLQRENR